MSRRRVVLLVETDSHSGDRSGFRVCSVFEGGAYVPASAIAGEGAAAIRKAVTKVAIRVVGRTTVAFGRFGPYGSTLLSVYECR